MLKKYNKATAAAITTAITGVIAASTNLDPELVAAIGVLISTIAVALIPNAK